MVLECLWFIAGALSMTIGVWIRQRYLLIREKKEKFEKDNIINEKRLIKLESQVGSIQSDLLTIKDMIYTNRYKLVDLEKQMETKSDKLV